MNAVITLSSAFIAGRILILGEGRTSIGIVLYFPLKCLCKAICKRIANGYLRAADLDALITYRFDLAERYDKGPMHSRETMTR